MLKDRQKSILEAVILEHIRTARPIASQEILGKVKLGVSPATVRNEMQTLDEEGYLIQPHTSAGRVPTDKGYRFFVDTLADAVLSREEEKQIDKVFDKRVQEECGKYLSRVLAEISGAFAAVGAFGEDMFYDNGLADILDEPEFEEAEAMRGFGRLVDLLDDAIPALFRNYAIGEEAIFIGQENPLKEARGYSMTVSRWKHPEGFEGFFAMVGPRRTHYEKHIAILNYLNEREEN